MTRFSKSFLALIAVTAALGAEAKAHEFAVQGDHRYVLSFDWSYEPAAGETDWSVRQKINFVTTNGTRVSVGAADRRPLPKPAGTRAGCEFHAPPDAAKVALDFLVQGKGRFAANDLRLDEVTDAPTVNVNPRFERGLGDWSGIARTEDDSARFFRTPDGRVHFFGGFDFTMTWVPVKAGRTYKIRLQAMSYNKNRVAPFLKFRGPGRPDLSTELKRGYKAKDSDAPIILEYDVAVPEGMTHLQLSFYYTTLDWIEIKEEK